MRANRPIIVGMSETLSARPDVSASLPGIPTPRFGGPRRDAQVAAPGRTHPQPHQRRVPAFGADLAALARQIGAVWAGFLAVGAGYGVLVSSAGLPWWFAPVSALVVFAGSAEFLLIGLLAAAAPIGAIALTTLLVNSRHVLYGLSFPLHRIRSRAGRLYSVYTLCDEAYALAGGPGSPALSGRRLVLLQAGLHLSAGVGALLGSVAGSSLLGGVAGLDFVMVALFVVIAMDAWSANRDRVVLAVSLGAVAVAWVLAPGQLVLVALVLLAAALVSRHHVQRIRRRPGSPAAVCGPEPTTGARAQT
jgi:branched chain amino acid efflux pump